MLLNYPAPTVSCRGTDAVDDILLHLRLPQDICVPAKFDRLIETLAGEKSPSPDALHIDCDQRCIRHVAQVALLVM